MTIDQVIAMIASVAACFAAIATYLTVWQMVEQRRASYRPELVITRSTFSSLTDEVSGGLASFLNWQEYNPGVSVADKSQSDHSIWSTYTVRLANIGLGAAKNVSITWSFPIEGFIQKTNEVTARANPPFSLEYRNGIVSVNNPQITSLWRNQTLRSLDFVLPAAIEGEPYRLDIPHAYILAVSAAVYAYFSSDAKTLKPDWPEVPALNVLLEFEDIGGDKYRVPFAIGFNLHAVQRDQFSASLEAKALK